MTDIKCPYCKNSDNHESVKSWKYKTTSVVRYKCKCGKFFQYYESSNGNYWTIPKKVVTDSKYL